MRLWVWVLLVVGIVVSDCCIHIGWFQAILFVESMLLKWSPVQGLVHSGCKAADLFSNVWAFGCSGCIGVGVFLKRFGNAAPVAVASCLLFAFGPTCAQLNR